MSRPDDFKEGPGAIWRWLARQLNERFLQKHSQVNYAILDLDAFRMALLDWWTRQVWSDDGKWLASKANYAPA